MGWKLEKIEFCGCEQLKPNEEKDVCIVLKEERRAAIHGTVKFPNGKPVKDAIVKLFKKNSCKGDFVFPLDKNMPMDMEEFKKPWSDCELIPITFTFTDECGQFLFGVDSYEDYVIKVFYYKPEKPCPPHVTDKSDKKE